MFVNIFMYMELYKRKNSKGDFFLNRFNFVIIT